MKSIGIVGAGLSGLSAGIHLLESGYNVTIFEKNLIYGGMCSSIYETDQLLDYCFHWMSGTSKNSKTYKLWDHLGAFNNVSIIHPNSFFKVIYKNDSLTFYKDLNKLEKELNRVSCIEDKPLIDRFINAIKELGICELETKLPMEFLDFKEVKENFKRLLKFRDFINISLEEYADSFKSEIIRFALKNNLVDKHYSAYYFLLTISNFVNNNASLPNVSSKKISENIYDKFISLGGKIYFDSPVSKIEIKDGVAKGIVVDNRVYLFDYIVSCADLHYTYKNLLNVNCPYEKYDLDKSYLTYSYLIFSYKVKKDLSKEEIETIIDVDKFNILNKDYCSISLRQYGYEKSFIENGYTTVQVILTIYKNELDVLEKMNREERNIFEVSNALFFLKFIKKYYKCNDAEYINYISGLDLENRFNSYNGSFMTYPLGAKQNQFLGSHCVDGISNLIIGNQWLISPGGTCVAILTGKNAAQTILKLDNKDFIDY